MAIPITTIDVTGVHVPAFQDVLAGVVEAYQGVYGSDVVLTPDTQDGQWLGILASSFNDVNAQVAAVYNAFSPSTAQGVGLSSIVKTNGLVRSSASRSTVDYLITGQAGTTILNGQIRDDAGNLWTLPLTVTIPLSGQITATAIANVIGAIALAAGAVDTANGKGTIATPTLGFQSATNLTAAATGAPVENDSQLRKRQSISTALPSRNLLDGLSGVIAAIPGVARFQAYENDTDTTNASGLPGHSIAYVVDGGNAVAIASAIVRKKGPGVGTYGSTTVEITDAYGVPRKVSFFRPVEPSVTWAVTLKALPGFTTAVQTAIAQALSDWTNGLGIGNSLYRTRAFVPANLFGGAGSQAFEVTRLAVARDGRSPDLQDLSAAFNEAFACNPNSVAFTVSS